MYTRMTFGKHKGRLLTDIPTQYLLWVLREADCVDPWLRQAIAETLTARRDGRDVPPRRQQAGAHSSSSQSRGVDVIDRSTVKAAVHDWYRKMAFRFHHDRGVDQAVMAALNVAHDELKLALAING